LAEQTNWHRAQARLNAINLPPTREPPATSHAADPERREERTPGGGMDLLPYALGVRVAPRNTPPNLDPALAQRYGYPPAGVPWKRPTNIADIADSITDPAGEVLEYLHRFDPELDEIAQAVRRPYSQFPVHWTEDYHALLPHLAFLKHFSTMFSVRAAARLRKQDLPGAFEDAMTCFRLARALSSEPLVVSQLVRAGQHSIAVRTLWEGMGLWNAEQLTALEQELAKCDFQQRFASAFRGERVLYNHFLDRFAYLGHSVVDMLSVTDSGTGVMILACQWIPGWRRQNQVRVNRYFENPLRQVLDGPWPASAADVPDQATLLASAGLAKITPYSVLALKLVPDLSGAPAKAARAETLNQLAIVACALERFRLEHGSYPKDLSALVPKFKPAAPRDPMSDSAFRYEASGVQYKLWSVGLNGRDDGGVMLRSRNDTQGDWVWPRSGLIQGGRMF
jgi:type II secretory pathway pseudopilin PulG